MIEQTYCIRVSIRAVNPNGAQARAAHLSDAIQKLLDAIGVTDMKMIGGAPAVDKPQPAPEAA